MDESKDDSTKSLVLEWDVCIIPRMAAVNYEHDQELFIQNIHNASGLYH